MSDGIMSGVSSSMADRGGLATLTRQRLGSQERMPPRDGFGSTLLLAALVPQHR